MQDNHLYYGLEADLADEIADPGEAVEDLVLYRQDISDLWKTILCLPERQKDLLCILRFERATIPVRCEPLSR